MNGQKQWTQVAVMALLVLAAMAAEGGKPEKLGEKKKKKNGNSPLKTQTHQQIPLILLGNAQLHCTYLIWKGDLFFVFVF